MLFASDLDRTLIYSRQFCEKYPKADSCQLQLIETHNGQELSVISQAAAKSLEELAELMMFVPVTTRTLAQYKRIILFKKKIPEYAVVSNGGIVLHKGRIDIIWQKNIKAKLESCMSAREILAKFQKLLQGEWILTAKQADELFYYFLVDTKQVPHKEINEFASSAASWGWQLILQERKLYLIPSVVNKGYALSYVKKKTGKNIIVAAGDSLLDVSMLNTADYPIVPRHGSLWPGLGQTMKFTEQKGILAAEEILSYVKDLYSDRMNSQRLNLESRKHI